MGALKAVRLWYGSFESAMAAVWEQSLESGDVFTHRMADG